MKKIVRIYSLTLLVVICVLPTVYAQINDQGQASVRFSLPPIALIDIEPAVNNAISFSLTTAIESGVTPKFTSTSDQKLWLNYSSALQSSGTKRKIVVQVVNGDIPKGINAFLEAGAYQGVGAGDLGETRGKVKLNQNPKTIISRVGNCYTGDGENNGHPLNFSIEIKNYNKLVSSEETNFTVLYTISDN